MSKETRYQPPTGGWPPSGRFSVRSGNVGTRIFSHRTGNFNNTTQNTFRCIVEIAADNFSAVRPIFINGADGLTYTVAGCNARALANLTDALPSPTTVTLPSSGVVPAGGSLRPNYLLGDWTYMQSVPRTDGGKGALVCFDAYVSNSATIAILGNNTTDIYTTWATRANRKFLFRKNTTDCVTTPANFTSTENINQSVFGGVQYISNGRVITVMGIGDSITDGRGTIIGEGFGTLACEEVSDLNDTVYEWANCGYAGVTSTSYANFLTNLTTAGIKPEIVVTANGSPNDNGSTITDANIETSKKNLAKMLLHCRDNGYQPIILTYLPTKASAKDYGATDDKRVVYNTLTHNRQPHPVVDFAGALSGAKDADGQIDLLGTTDGIHPNDAGNAILAKLLAQVLRSFNQ